MLMENWTPDSLVHPKTGSNISLLNIAQAEFTKCPAFLFSSPALMELGASAPMTHAHQVSLPALHPHLWLTLNPILRLSLLDLLAFSNRCYIGLYIVTILFAPTNIPLLISTPISAVWQCNWYVNIIHLDTSRDLPYDVCCNKVTSRLSVNWLVMFIFYPCAITVCMARTRRVENTS